jgi:LysR family glycine cleavage system transcriptional activator
MLLPRRLMPSIPELIAFEAAARHESFSAAAEELCLTQGAVSKQIRNMELTLGISLFDRRRKRLMLTRQARSILPSVIDILSKIADTTYKILSSGGSASTVNLYMFSTFSSRWMVPRLPSLLEKHPELTLTVSTVFESFSFDETDCDIAIHYGQPVWPNGTLHYLFNETLVPVCSPAYRDALGIRDTRDFPRARLIQLNTRPALWEYWFSSLGIEMETPFTGNVFDQFNATIEAAISGLGIALVPSIFVERELCDDVLCLAAKEQISGQGAYYIVTPAEKTQDPAIAAVVNWFLEESAHYRFSRQVGRKAGASTIRKGKDL